MKNVIVESFRATRGISESELNAADFYDNDTTDTEVNDESDTPIDVVDRDIETDEEGEQKSYVGRYVATCPVCAEPFFCSEEAQIIEGICHDLCPVCQEEVDAKVIGVVSPLESEDDESSEESGDGDNSSEVSDTAEVEVESSKVCGKCGKTPCECKISDPAPLEFDETTMNNLLKQFVQENYSSTIKSIRVDNVRRNKKSLTIEAKVTYNRGKTRIVEFVIENFKIGRKMTLESTCKGLGITSNPITFSARLKGGAIVVESMKYDYVTKMMVEGKVRKAQVVGSHSV